MVDFNTLLKTYQEQVDDKISEYSERITPNSMKEPFKYLMQSGGKRLRPVLVLLLNQIYGNESNEALDTAVAIEILHNFTLVHDDIMDRSPLRRNRQTIHKKWNDATAILLGDLMMGICYNLLPHNNPLFCVFNLGLLEVCQGQALDLDFSSRKDVTVEEFIRMIELKTSSLLRTAILAGAYCSRDLSKDEYDLLFGIGTDLGIAFQIQDDLLDLTANSAELGKIIGQDIVEGKKTYLILKGIEKAEKDEHKQLLNSFLELNGLPQEKVPEMRNTLEELGVIQDTIKISEYYFARAIESINKLPDNKYRKAFLDLVDYLKQRNF